MGAPAPFDDGLMSAPGTMGYNPAPGMNSRTHNPATSGNSGMNYGATRPPSYR
jgi:hypothetical protein